MNASSTTPASRDVNTPTPAPEPRSTTPYRAVCEVCMEEKDMLPCHDSCKASGSKDGLPEICADCTRSGIPLFEASAPDPRARTGRVLMLTPALLQAMMQRFPELAEGTKKLEAKLASLASNPDNCAVFSLCPPPMFDFLLRSITGGREEVHDA